MPSAPRQCAYLVETGQFGRVYAQEEEETVMN